MVTKTQIILLLALSIVGFVIGHILTNSTQFSLCTHDQYNCRELLNHIGDPLYFGMGALAIVFLVLVFVPKAWTAWKKFAIWFVPLATLLFISYRDPGSMNLISPYAETVFVWVSGIYIAISLVIIAIAVGKKKVS